MRLQERDDALTALGGLLDRSLQSRGGVALISGALGVGKTALLQEFAEQSVKAGAAFLPAVASRAERDHPLAVISQLFRPDLLPSAQRVQPPEAIAGSYAPAFRTIHEALDKLVERKPTVIGVDDAHFADQASLQGLLYLARRLRRSRVLLVISARNDWVHVEQQFHAEVLRLPNSASIRLQPLSRSAVAAILAERLDRKTAHRLSAQCHRASGGSPLLAHALAEDFRIAAAATEPQFAAGDNFGRAVLGCLHRGEPSMLETARGYAILGERASPSLLGGLLGLDAGTAARAVNALIAAGLLHAGRFRAEGTQAAILSGMSADEKRPLHQRAAQLLYENGAPAAIVADELVAAGGVQAPWAGPLLRTAADGAMLDGEPGRAVTWLKLAHRTCADESARAVIAARLADALWRVDPAAAAEHLPELVTATRTGLLNGSHAALPYFHLLWLGRTDEALDLARSINHADDAAASQIKQALVADFSQLWLPFCYPGLAGQLPDERAMPATLATSALAPQYRAAAALAAVMAGSPVEDVVGAAERVLAGTRLHETTLMPITAALLALFYGARPDRTTYWCEALLAEATAQRVPMWQALFATVRAGIHLQRGELADAERQAHTALTLVSPGGWGVAIGAPLAFCVYTATATGKYEQAAAYLNIEIPEATFQTLCGVHYLGARGDFYLATGRFHAALADFQTCGRLLCEWGIDVPAIVPWRVECVRAHICLDNIKQAAELLNDQLALLDGEPSRVRGLTLRALAATRDVEDRVPLLREAVDIFLAQDYRLDLTYALADLSDTYRRLAEYKEARTTARSAIQFAERCGAEPLRLSLLAKCGDDAAQSADSGWIARLSRAERKVALLAAEGYTNRQIAQRLSISISTVEQHMTRVYRKLEVTSRSSLWPRLHFDLAARPPVAG